MKYKYKTKPYVHQVKALKKLLSTGWGGALLMEPRTGKTKVAIDYASILHSVGHVNRAIIFCPAGVMGVWEEEIPKHCPVPHRITFWDKTGRKDTPLPKFGKDVLDFLIVNYDAFSAPPDWRRTRKKAPLDKNGKKPIAWFLPIEGSNRWQEVPVGTPDAVRLRSKGRGGRYAFRDKIEGWQPQLVILDESHRIKTPSAKKSQMLHRLGPKVQYRVIMTGTVVTKAKRIYDVFSQWRFLNPNRFVEPFTKIPLNYAEFKEEYSVIRKVGEMGYPKWIRNKNEGRLHKLMHKDAFSVLREDCFDMPPHTPQIIRVHLDESAQAYDEMTEDMVTRIETGEITEASIALVQGIRLRQLSNGLAKTSPTKDHPKGRVVIIGSEKLDVLADRLEDLMEAGEHVIIGASLRPDIQRIEKLCRERKWKAWVVMGGVKLRERIRIRKEFEAFPDGCVFIGNPAAASEGIDLRSSAILIWYSLPQSWVHYRQYMDRNALHPGPRFTEYLVATPMDELMYETLLVDGDIGKKMIMNPKRLRRHDRG